MNLPRFLADLFDHGRVRVAGRALDFADQAAAADELLISFERQYRLELLGTPPDLDLPVARWAARTMYRACQLLVVRDADQREVELMLADESPTDRTAAADYSADLCLRYLPDLYRQAGAMSAADPLTGVLARLGTAWPLSSVGMNDLGPLEIDTIAGHPSLMMLYVDRIVARGDLARLADPRVAEAVRQAVGIHTELAPRIETHLAAESE